MVVFGDAPPVRALCTYCNNKENDATIKDYPEYIHKSEAVAGKRSLAQGL